MLRAGRPTARFDSGHGQEIFSVFQKATRGGGGGGHSQTTVEGDGLAEVKQLVREVYHHRLVPSLRMTGAVLRPPYVIMAFTGQLCFFTLINRDCYKTLVHIMFGITGMYACCTKRRDTSTVPRACLSTVLLFEGSQFSPVVVTYLARCTSSRICSPFGLTGDLCPLSVLWFKQHQLPWIVCKAILVCCICTLGYVCSDQKSALPFRVIFWRILFIL